MHAIPDFWFEPRIWLDGQWHSTGESFAVFNPATGERLVEVARADAAATGRAIEGAVRALGQWRETPAAVRVLSLTGSSSTGSALMSRAAAGIKRLALELGGNAPFVVLPDADLDFAADELVRLKLLCSGQVCVKMSGLGVEGGPEGIREFLDIQVISMPKPVLGAP